MKGRHWGGHESTFDSLFDIKVLEFTSLRMEAYRNNSSVELLIKVHPSFRWKRNIYRQLFYITNADNSPNLLSRDGCYTLRVIQPCYSVESHSSSSKFQGIPEAVPIQPTVNLEKAKWQGGCNSHCENEGTDLENPNCSNK